MFLRSDPMKRLFPFFNNPRDKTLHPRPFFRFSTIVLIIILGFLIRLYASINTYIVNPDATLYIHQARALYYGQWDQLTSCITTYLSIYPVFIAVARAAFQDWIIAARFVSLFFGTLTLIPLYLLLYRLFRKEISALCLLVFALLPFHVNSSADIIRGPVFWLFLLLGVNFFVAQIRKNKYCLSLLLSSLSFLMASASRPEAILFIVMSSLYLFLEKQQQKINRIACFVFPILVIWLFGVFGAPSFGTHMENIFRIKEVLEKLITPLSHYELLRANLADVASTTDGLLRAFIFKARNMVWLVAVGTLFAFVIKAFFYPFFFVFLIGVSSLPSKIKEDLCVRYLVILAGSSLILLFMHILQTWHIYKRFVAIFLLPAFIGVGYGLERIINFISSRLRLKTSIALTVVSFLILAVSLPKNLKSRELDKLVFKNIGEQIACIEGNTAAVCIVSSLRTLRWVSFYANLKYPGAPCPQPYADYKEIIGTSYREFLQNLKDRGIKYFIWEEKRWPSGAFDFLREFSPEDFKDFGTWSHPDTGRIILYRVL